MELIQTGWRDKLPKGLSYPVGAELISAALAGVPQFDDLSIYFSITGWMSITSGAEDDEAQPFMRAFSAGLNFNVGNASVSVPAVPSMYRQTVRKALVDYGMPKVKSWLDAPRPQTWFEGFRIFTVGVLPDSGETRFVETQNSKVV